MKMTEIIEKVKKNLLLQDQLKNELEDTLASSEITAEKISHLEEKINCAEKDELELKSNIIADIKNNSNLLKDHIKLYSKSVYGDEDYKYGLKVSFMGKERVLTDSDYELWSRYGQKNVEVFVGKMFEDYLIKGTTIFNKNNTDKLLEFKKLYDLRPDIVEEKLISMDLNKQMDILKKELADKNIKLSNSVADLISVNSKIKKLPTFKSELMNKLFRKRSVLLNKKQEILDYNDKCNKEIKSLGKRMANKSVLKDISKIYVQVEIKSLIDVFAWIDSFEEGKRKLARFTEEHIDVLNSEVEDLKEKLANGLTKTKELKGMLKLNKKLTSEIVENALMNKNIVKELNSIDFNNVSKQDEKAVEFIKAKYNEYIFDCVEKMVK